MLDDVKVMDCTVKVRTNNGISVSFVCDLFSAVEFANAIRMDVVRSVQTRPTGQSISTKTIYLLGEPVEVWVECAHPGALVHCFTADNDGRADE